MDRTGYEPCKREGGREGERRAIKELGNSSEAYEYIPEMA